MNFDLWLARAIEAIEMDETPDEAAIIRIRGKLPEPMQQKIKSWHITPDTTLRDFANQLRQRFIAKPDLDEFLSRLNASEIR